MQLLDRLAEEKIQQAIDKGCLQSLNGQGLPIKLQPLDWVPESWRLVYLLLKNSGFLPHGKDLFRPPPDSESLVLQLYTHQWLYSKT